MGIKTERKIIESTYDDKCNIYQFTKTKENGITSTAKQLIKSNVDCALSQKTLNATAQTNTANSINYDAKLFLAPEILVAPGSHIEVTRLDRSYLFESAGEAFVYPTHQEILLLRKDKA